MRQLSNPRLRGLPRSGGRWWRVLAAALLLTSTAAAARVAGAAPAQALGTYTLTGKGLDSCTAPSLNQMSNFWRNTPYWYWGIYIGGNQRSCSQPNLTASWISSVTSQGWRLLPLWVGPQDPCEHGFGSYISTNTTTAYSQGKNEAAAAYNAWTGTLGQSVDTPIDYDLEYNGHTITSTCLAAMQSFISGWVFQLHIAPAQVAGVYTSSSGGDLNAFASIANVPDFIDGADYNGNPSTADLAGIPSGNWVNHQRHKQYAGGHNETWNGSTINVDSRCANAAVYATGDEFAGEGC